MQSMLLLVLLAVSAEPERLEFELGNLKREAIVYLPAKASEMAAPVVFGFHGHGGTARHAAGTFRIQDLWPEAIVVYMQGVPTPGRLSDPEGKRPGWQHDPGDHGDRDLKFFDAVLASLREKHKVDDNRIYATGHSNGAAFTYVLWAARHDVLAAVAPSAGGSRSLRTARPLPVLQIAGEKDPLVRFAGQQLIATAIRRLNGCDAEGREWDKNCIQHPSKTGTPLVTFIHPGDHTYPAEAPALIVRFFKEHARPEKQP